MLLQAFLPSRFFVSEHMFCACAVAVICGLVAAGGAISNAIQEQNEREALVASVTAYDDKYVPNVYVDGIHLGGMTRAEAEEAVTAPANQQRDAWKVSLILSSILTTVVVINALSPTRGACLSTTVSTIFSGGTSFPRSMTSYP